MTEFARFAQDQLSDLDIDASSLSLGALDDGLKKAINERRKQYIEGQLDQFPFTSTQARAQAKRFLEREIPIIEDPRFAAGLVGAQAQQQITSQAPVPPANDVADAPTSPRRVVAGVDLSFLDDGRDVDRRVRDRNFLQRAGDTIGAGAVSLFGGFTRGIGGLGEGAVRAGLPSILERNNPIINFFEGVQDFGSDFIENNLPENVLALREQNARIGAERGVGARIGHFFSNPELIGDVLGNSIGTVVGSGGGAGLLRTGAVRVAAYRGQGSNVAKLKGIGQNLLAKTPRVAQGTVRRVGQATPVGIAVGELNADDVYRSVKDIPEEDAKVIPEYMLIEASYRSRGVTPTHDQVLEDMARTAERTAARWGTGASILAMALPGGTLIERTVSKIPSRLIGGAAIRGTSIQTSRKAVVGSILKGAAGEAVSEGLEERSQVAAQNAAIRSLVSGETPFAEEFGSQEARDAGTFGAVIGGALGGAAGLISINRSLDKQIEGLLANITEETTVEQRQEIFQKVLGSINSISSGSIPVEENGEQRVVRENNITPEIQAEFVRRKAEAIAEQLELENVQSLINEVAYESRAVPIPETGQSAINDTRDIQEGPEELAEAARQDEDVARALEFVNFKTQSIVEQQLKVTLPDGSRFSEPFHDWTNEIEDAVIFSSDQSALVANQDGTLTEVRPDGSRSDFVSTELLPAIQAGIEYQTQSVDAVVNAPPAPTEFSGQTGFDAVPVEIEGGISFGDTNARQEEDGLRVSSPDGGSALYTIADQQFAGQIVKRVDDGNRLTFIEDASFDAFDQAQRNREYRVPTRPVDSNVARTRNDQDAIRAKYGTDYKSLRDSDTSSDEDVRQESLLSRIFSRNCNRE